MDYKLRVAWWSLLGALGELGDDYSYPLDDRLAERGPDRQALRRHRGSRDRRPGHGGCSAARPTSSARRWSAPTATSAAASTIRCPLRRRWFSPAAWRSDCPVDQIW